MKPGAIQRVFDAALATSRQREDWATVFRNFERVFQGVSCNVHFKVQLIWQMVGSTPRVTGECFVYLTARGSATLPGGCGWVHFSVAETGLAHAERLFELALAEALRELSAAPEIRSRLDQEELRASTPGAPDCAPPRRARMRI